MAYSGWSDRLGVGVWGNLVHLFSRLKISKIEGVGLVGFGRGFGKGEDFWKGTSI